ncbi:hypothetical protein EON64_07720 [archaeon]|nr:MAG: hypothetical protein EON64_07720 [archaeon]
MRWFLGVEVCLPMCFSSVHSLNVSVVYVYVYGALGMDLRSCRDTSTFTRSVTRTSSRTC